MTYKQYRRQYKVKPKKKTRRKQRDRSFLPTGQISKKHWLYAGRWWVPPWVTQEDLENDDTVPFDYLENA